MDVLIVTWQGGGASQPADPLHTALVRRAAASIVVMTPEFDDWPDPPPNVTHVGPIFEEHGAKGWESPWQADDP